MLLLLTQLWLSFSLAQAQMCTPEGLVDQVCQKLKNNSSDFIKMGPDQIIINPTRFEKVYETLKDIREPSKKELARMDQLFLKTKAELIKKIENGIPYSQLSPVKKNMVDRINLVKLVNPEDMQMEQRQRCQIEKLGAFFHPNNSTVEMCPLFYQYPAEPIMFFLAHEISHAIDPCAVNHNIYQITLEQVDQSYELNSMPESEKINKSDEGASLTSGMIRYFVDDEDKIYFSDQGTNKEVLKKLFAKQSIPAPVVQGLQSVPYPYSDSLTCQKPTQVSSAEKDCSLNPQSEIMCDHFGAWTLNSLLPDKLTENQKVTMVAGLFPDVCNNDPKKKTHGYHYLNSRKRMTEILLKMPGMMEKMGCPPLKENKCFIDFTTSHAVTLPGAKKTEGLNQR
ncbi:MAG: hypothetical protein ACK5V3_11430 [Bdellovibrionales bacterium]